MKKEDMDLENSNKFIKYEVTIVEWNLAIIAS